MIVDIYEVRKWTKKVAEAINKAAQQHPGEVLTVVNTSKSKFDGLHSRRFTKRRVYTWKMYQPFPLPGIEGAHDLIVTNEDSDSIPLPRNWSYPYLYTAEWDGKISDQDKIVKEFW